MNSKEIISLVWGKRRDGVSLRNVAADLKISTSIVEYMLKNDYNWKEKKRGRKMLRGKKTRRGMKMTVFRVVADWKKLTKLRDKQKCGIDVNIRNVQRTPKEIRYKNGKAKRNINLNIKHKKASLD